MKGNNEEPVRRGIVEEIHAPARRNFPTRQVILKGIHDLWQSDLVDIQAYAKENGQNRYILTVINCFTKEAYAKPLKSKSGLDVTKAFEEILQQNVPPMNMQVGTLGNVLNSGVSSNKTFLSV